MRPAYVALIFLIIGLINVLSSRQSGSDDASTTDIASKTRRRTGTIFLLVAVGLFLLDWFGGAS